MGIRHLYGAGRAPRRSVVRGAAVAVGCAATLAAVAACGSSSSSSGSGWGKATSAASDGGMSALVKAAQKEGTLNVIALPPTWANYGEELSTFSKKYGIKITSANHNGSSQDEITAVQRLGNQSRAPDVLDVGQSFATADTGLFAPYKVSTWSGIPAANKASTGSWYNDYGGYISFGCNTKLVKVCPTSFADLLKPQYKNMVALDGDPTQANAAFSGVWAASLANGGSLDNIKPGLDFFGKLKKAGNFNRTQATQATIQSGQTPIVIDWDYLNAAAASKLKAIVPFKVTVPSDASFAAYYAQAINAKAPHPAAARLWEEFLYSNQGQNLWLKGLARPIRLTQMTTNGTADKTFLTQLPQANPNVTYPTDAQTTAAKTIVAQGWGSATS
jgi:putative spermidine/putrescine transport system substrate-binding protein